MDAVRRLTASPEEALMLGVAKNLDSRLADLGKAVVREIVTYANKLGVAPDDLPYVFWALATGTGLPRLGAKEHKALTTAMFIMERTGTMPNYSSAFSVASSGATDAAVDEIARHMGTWSLRTLFPGLLQAYKDALNSQVKQVQKKTNGQVPKGREFDFLRKAFRRVVPIQSRMFRDGELLFRVVNLMPI
jgi:hypothetical protein